MEIRQNEDMETPGLEIVRTGSGESVLTCVETDGLSLGMEICANDNTGMGLDCDEEILTASSLGHVHEREGGEGEEEGEEEREREEWENGHTDQMSEASSKSNTTRGLSPSQNDDRLTLFLLGSHAPGLHNDWEDDSSMMDTASQSSQTDLTYHASVESSSQGDITGDPVTTSDIGTATASDEEDDDETGSVAEEAGGVNEVGVVGRVCGAGEGGRRRKRRGGNFGRRRRRAQTRVSGREWVGGVCRSIFSLSLSLSLSCTEYKVYSLRPSRKTSAKKVFL